MKTLNKWIVICLVALLTCIPQLANGKGQYVQPLNMGMNAVIPWDLANIWNRPVNGSQTAAIFAACSLLFILFFGVITSPFGYFFGVPSQKYVLGQKWGELTGIVDQAEGRNFENGEKSETSGDFEERIFYWMNHVKEVECRQLVLCHGHQVMRKMPKSLLKVFAFFSKKLMGMSEEYKDSIVKGFKRKTVCEEEYSNCPDSIFGIAVRTAINLMPKWTRKKALKPNLTF